MDSVNRTLYIPLYGKAFVSRKGIIIHDPKAEYICESCGLNLSGSAGSKWLAYFMAMRAAVYDTWLTEKLQHLDKTVVIHIGCGLDSRVERVGGHHMWYDVDFPEVIEERKKFYSETENYHMIGANAVTDEWENAVSDSENAVIVMEGVCMYIEAEDIIRLFERLKRKFTHVYLMADFYTTFGVKASKYKNPVNQVGVTELHGIDDPHCLETDAGLAFKAEHDMTPAEMIKQLDGSERFFFKTMFAGKAAKKIYRLYEYGG